MQDSSAPVSFGNDQYCLNNQIAESLTALANLWKSKSATELAELRNEGKYTTSTFHSMLY